ncbi:branched-chain amino acid permease [Neisseria meningitidis]|nr:branched-chain amino acid permease [Neisseria meningitidis]MBG8592751.1 branched-chain amino acid permease [Neisseria meningitidis]MBG8594644.1 branched-chain amino acid permease [Neisseria meningitidis]MBG8603810.1 branched-chain amino acid permease [Neisseria meningitidis]MBG8610495.1 branched-chain amino acid permease [Neisseria meningitidis]
MFFIVNPAAGAAHIIAPFVFPCFLYSGLTKTGTALPRLSSKRTIL